MTPTQHERLQRIRAHASPDLRAEIDLLVDGLVHGRDRRWIVRYRRYSSDSWSEKPFTSEAEARKFKDEYLYDRGFEAQAVIRNFVEI